MAQLYRFEYAYGAGELVSTIPDIITNAGTFNHSYFLAGDGTFKAPLSSPLSGGYAATSFNAGTQSSGTFTPSYTNGNYQFCVNGGAFTLAAPVGDGVVNLMVTNNGSAGTVTFSGFTVGLSTGDAIDTVNSHMFLISMITINSISTYIVKALQ